MICSNSVSKFFESESLFFGNFQLPLRMRFICWSVQLAERLIIEIHGLFLPR